MARHEVEYQTGPKRNGIVGWVLAIAFAAAIIAVIVAGLRVRRDTAVRVARAAEEADFIERTKEARSDRKAMCDALDELERQVEEALAVATNLMWAITNACLTNEAMSTTNDILGNCCTVPGVRVEHCPRLGDSVGERNKEDQNQEREVSNAAD